MLHIPLGHLIMLNNARGSQVPTQVRLTCRGAKFTLTGCIPSLVAAFKFPVTLRCGNKSSTEEKEWKHNNVKEMLLFQAVSIFLFFFFKPTQRAWVDKSYNKHSSLQSGA